MTKPIHPFMRPRDQSRQAPKHEKIEAVSRRLRWRRSKGDTWFHENSLTLGPVTVAGNIIANPSWYRSRLAKQLIYLIWLCNGDHI